MSRDSFRRLALMAATAAVCAAIAACWIYLHWVIGAAAIVGGTIVALALTVEPQPSRSRSEREKVADDLAGVARGLGHREIARRARVSADDGDEAA